MPYYEKQAHRRGAHVRFALLELVWVGLGVSSGWWVRVAGLPVNG